MSDVVLFSSLGFSGGQGVAGTGASGDQLQCDKLSFHRSAISTDGSDAKVETSSSATNFRPTEVQFQPTGPTQNKW